VRHFAATPGCRFRSFSSAVPFSVIPEVLQLLDFAEKPLAFAILQKSRSLIVRHLGKAVFEQNLGFFGRIKSLQHFPFARWSVSQTTFPSLRNNAQVATDSGSTELFPVKSALISFHNIGSP
jgi:hypothetical protein